MSDEHGIQWNVENVEVPVSKVGISAVSAELDECARYGCIHPVCSNTRPLLLALTADLNAVRPNRQDELKQGCR